MKKLSLCLCCREPVADVARRHDDEAGCVCPECYDFREYAGLALAAVGVSGVVHSPERFTSTPSPETP